MADLTALAVLSLLGQYTLDADINTVKDIVDETIELELADGTGTGYGDLQFHDQRQLSDGGNEELDLAGSLTDQFGSTLTFAKIKLLVIENLSASQTLTVGNASSNQFVGPFGAAAHTLGIGPNSFAVLIANPAGYAVTAGTGDKLKILNSAGSSCLYNIFIWGATA